MELEEIKKMINELNSSWIESAYKAQVKYILMALFEKIQEKSGEHKKQN